MILDAVEVDEELGVPACEVLDVEAPGPFPGASSEEGPLLERKIGVVEEILEREAPGNPGARIGLAVGIDQPCAFSAHDRQHRNTVLAGRIVIVHLGAGVPDVAQVA